MAKDELKAGMLSVKQAADELGVNSSKIRKLIKDGKIKALQLAERSPYRIPSTEIERLKGTSKIKDWTKNLVD